MNPVAVTDVTNVIRLYTLFKAVYASSRVHRYLFNSCAEPFEV